MPQPNPRTSPTLSTQTPGARDAPGEVSARPPGRPTLYREDYVVLAFEACLLGATDEELAEYFSIHVATLYEWKNRYPEFAEAIKSGKRPADQSVATALHGRATGAEWKEEQAIKVKRVEYSESGKRILEEERVEIVEVTRRAPPDTTAAIFWLKNRRATDWRDKIEHTGDPLQPLTFRIVRE